jgi:hypothetical protein
VLKKPRVNHAQRPRLATGKAGRFGHTFADVKEAILDHTGIDARIVP